MKSQRIFLDDRRDPEDCLSYMHRRIGPLNAMYLEEWTVVRNFKEFQQAVEEAGSALTHVSFDHDLDDSHYENLGRFDENGELVFDISNSVETGYECALWLIEHCKKTEVATPTVFVHSTNDAGQLRIEKLFRS